MRGPIHRQHSVSGRSTRHKPGARPPAGTSNIQYREENNGRPRERPYPRATPRSRNPECEVDTNPARAIMGGWFAKKLDIAAAAMFVAAEEPDDTLHLFALNAYTKYHETRGLF